LVLQDLLCLLLLLAVERCSQGQRLLLLVLQ
jgi:hypothetical protein